MCAAESESGVSPGNCVKLRAQCAQQGEGEGKKKQKLQMIQNPNRDVINDKCR